MKRGKKIRSQHQRLSQVTSPRTSWLGRLQVSSTTLCHGRMMIVSPYLCGRLGFVQVLVFPFHPCQQTLLNALVDNLVSTLMVTTFRHVSVNLQHYQHTNGSCIGSVWCSVRLDTGLKHTKSPLRLVMKTVTSRERITWFIHVEKMIGFLLTQWWWTSQWLMTVSGVALSVQTEHSHTECPPQELLSLTVIWTWQYGQNKDTALSSANMTAIHR